MGAGSSTEQRSPEQPAGSDTPSELELSGHGPAAEASGAAGDPADADPATKLPQKNGQLSTVNGVAEQGDVHVQEENQEGQEEEVVDEDGKLPLQARLTLAGHWELEGRLHLAVNREQGCHILSTENTIVL